MRSSKSGALMLEVRGACCGSTLKEQPRACTTPRAGIGPEIKRALKRDPFLGLMEPGTSGGLFFHWCCHTGQQGKKSVSCCPLCRPGIRLCTQLQPTIQNLRKELSKGVISSHSQQSSWFEWIVFGCNHPQHM